MTVLSGGVGGARLARALAGPSLGIDLTVVVNVGDDDDRYGLHVSADVDTVVYTLAGIEGPEGWGRRDDSWEVMAGLATLGVDTTFRVGDHDLATNLFRTAALRAGTPLSVVTATVASALGVDVTVLPATDDPVRTKIRTTSGEWLDFQEYFVERGHRDRVGELRFDGAGVAGPAPGVIEAIRGADAVIIAPSNPPLSIWPILAVPAIGEAVAGAATVVAISPLFGGRALKGPAADVLADLGLPDGNAGILAAYEGVCHHLVVDEADHAGDAPGSVGIVPMNTRMVSRAEGRRFAAAFLRWLRSTHKKPKR